MQWGDFSLVGVRKLLVPRPGKCTPSVAAALPTVYTTVDVAFAELAKLKKGEKAPKQRSEAALKATGGVGLVAVQYAQRLGAEAGPRVVTSTGGRDSWGLVSLVYTTAGREEKRQYLRDLGVKYITSSRNGEEFEKEMKEFLKVAKFRSDVKYHLLAIDGVCENEPDRYQGLLKRSWKPLEATEFEGLSKGVEALQFLQRAQHIGKAPGPAGSWMWMGTEPPEGYLLCTDYSNLTPHHCNVGVVLTVPRRMALPADASYLLSGGMGALGLVTAQALAEEGAKSLLLMSRSAPWKMCPW
eukprot:Skav210427  [mRNA]  locus=scaffold1573:420116:427042:+ [translate_table: standard]